MAESSIEIFGRKIFFLNPAYSVKMEAITELQKQEYEVYFIENYRDAKNILRHNQDALLFINVDAQLPMNCWYNFVRSFEKEDVLKTIYITIISERIKASDRELFNNTPECPGGVIGLEEGSEEVLKKILEILNTTKAKGKRQYVRANLTFDKDAALFWNAGQKLHQLKLLDLSTVGMSAKVPHLLGAIISKNTILRDLTLRLGPKQLPIEAVVYGTKTDETETIWILLLLPSTSDRSKDIIRSYISERIQKEMMASINNEHQDDTDYQKLEYYGLSTKQKISKPADALSFTQHEPGSNV